MNDALDSIYLKGMVYGDCYRKLARSFLLGQQQAETGLMLRGFGFYKSNHYQYGLRILQLAITERYSQYHDHLDHAL